MGHALEVGLDFTAAAAVVVGGRRDRRRRAGRAARGGAPLPKDVSLIGFDDVPYAADLTPTLTAARVPYEELGRSLSALSAPDCPGRARDCAHSPPRNWPETNGNSPQHLDM
ncbi:substrate-binding domain-containing protein [Streptomyces sp. NPDC005374]|uniref:substrate-binding domain-containing protein n=1 Tax=Streptomyces sp. NPDC005374 TaxID=3364713 RepID=UPI003684B4B4